MAGDPPSGSFPLRAAPGPREMLLVAGLAFFLNLFPGTLLQLAQARLGLVLTELLFIAGPAIVAVRLFYLDPRKVLPIGRPAGGALAGALLGAAGVNHLLTLAGALQETVWPTPAPLRALFDDLFVYRSPADFILLILVFAVVPAVAEELLFRGFLQAGLARLLDRRWLVVLVSALIFALFHLDPWRFPGVLGLGLFLGWLRERSGSLIPTMAAHATSNILSIAMKASGRLEGDAAPGTVMTAALAAAALLVAAILVAGPRRASERML
jgi:membrane protease YdiL (CAAX protease family)